jgi:predicted amidophosphoribosyltransferase
MSASVSDPMPEIHPMRIPGRWREGFALDYHTASSVYLGDNEHGHPQFETTYTEVGGMLYRLKSKADVSVVQDLAEAIAQFVSSWQTRLDALIPVPPSQDRSKQPALLVGKAVSDRLGIPFADDWVIKVRETPQLKNVFEFDKRLELLQGAFDVENSKVDGKRVLLLDDLFRSGATMNALTDMLYT